MTASPSPRAPLVSIVGALPDVGLEVFSRARRTTVRIVHVSTEVARSAADVASKPAPMQASLQAVAVRVAPIQAQGAALREHETARLRGFASAAVDAVIGVAMQVVGRIPLDQIIANVDLNAILAQVDLNALLASIDIGPLINTAMQEIDFGSVIRDSTSGVTSEMRDAGRATAMHGDLIVARVFDKIVRRRERNLQVGLAT
jgi:hypothetical protein